MVGGCQGEVSSEAVAVSPAGHTFIVSGTLGVMGNRAQEFMFCLVCFFIDNEFGGWYFGKRVFAWHAIIIS